MDNAKNIEPNQAKVTLANSGVVRKVGGQQEATDSSLGSEINSYLKVSSQPANDHPPPKAQADDASDDVPITTQAAQPSTSPPAAQKLSDSSHRTASDQRYHIVGGILSASTSNFGSTAQFTDGQVFPATPLRINDNHSAVSSPDGGPDGATNPEMGREAEEGREDEEESQDGNIELDVDREMAETASNLRDEHGEQWKLAETELLERARANTIPATAIVDLLMLRSSPACMEAGGRVPNQLLLWLL